MIVYKSKRVGRYGVPFTMFKLRTMVIGADTMGGPSTSGDDPRLTRIGKFLRKYKIDELPQLWNVMKRDMNLVGPRPEVQEVVDLMTPEEKKIILSVRPGLTDLATLWDCQEEEMLRGEADPHQAYLKKIWPEKKRLQIEYIRNRNIRMDLWILFQTLKKIILR